MRKWKAFFTQNTIMQLLASHILVLLFSLFAMGYGFSSAFEIVRQDAYNSYNIMLDHSVSIIDAELEKLQLLSLQITQDKYVREYAEYSQSSSDYIVTALKAKENVGNLMTFQSIEMVSRHYIYFPGKDRILFESSYYRPDLFEKYVFENGISTQEWYDAIISPGRRQIGFERVGEEILYIHPFSSSLFGDNQGVSVISLKNSVFSKLLNFRNSYEENDFYIQIYDENGNYLWSDGELDIEPLSEKINFPGLSDGAYIEDGDISIFSTVSGKSGWQYVLFIPRKTALQHLLILKNLVFVVIGIAFCVGIFVSIYQSVTKGKPINQAVKMLVSSGHQSASVTNLGEAVTSILKNHEELLTEFEREKPLLRKAFFNDLIKGEFSTDAQLRIAAEKAGIRLNDTSYLVSSLELFAGNDFYAVDSQTLNEIPIITQLLENRLSQMCGEVWVYKRNYRTFIVIFPVSTSSADVKKLIYDVRKWLLEQYQVETNWGIANQCDDLLVMWKAAEEAMLALHYSGSSAPIVKYKSELENTDEFYFPEIAREKLLEGILSNHFAEVKTILAILEEENCSIRKLKRSQFIKFNQRIVDTIHSMFKADDAGREYVDWHIMRLNEVIMEPEISEKEYFRRLTKICENACVQNTEKKNLQKSAMIEDVKAYIKTNFTDSNLGLAQIGIVFRVSEGYLSALFREYSGVNFTDYLEEIRVKKATELLKDHSNTVDEVAKQVGYNSAQAFRRAFKRATGVSPKEVRKEQKD